MNEISNHHPTIMLKLSLFAVVVVAFLPQSSFGWIRYSSRYCLSPPPTGKRSLLLLLRSSSSSDNSQEDHVHLGLDPENPCWQDIADNDCALSTAYSASFVAKKWIKSMPCAEGIADCDMPEATSHPGHEGVEDVDMMEFLGIKRAKAITNKPADVGTTKE